MDWIDIGTFIITTITLMTVFIRVLIDYKDNRINRNIEVKIKYRREKQQQLFKYVNILLNSKRKTDYSIWVDRNADALYEVLDAKVNIWINLNYENKCSEELRNECVELATWVASYFENPQGESAETYKRASDKNQQKIWILINKYIEDEERIDKELLK